MADGGVLSTIRGVSVGSLITGAGVWTGVFTLLGIILRSRVPMKKMKIAADESLRAELLERLHQVETTAADRVQRLEEKMESQRVAYEARLEKERVTHEAEMSIMRHRANNMAQCLDAILMLVEAAPEKAAEHVSKIKEMRTRQEVAEAAEKAGLHAGKINAAGALTDITK